MYWSNCNGVNNAGDLIGPFLFGKMCGKVPAWTKPSNRALRQVYVSAGSVMGGVKDNCIVLGSGIMTRDARFSRPAEVTA
ncbi:MAG: hypothetical protein AB7K09_15575, partial [Planctomycetota bacterium]